MLDWISFLFHFVPSINIGINFSRDGFLNGMESRHIKNAYSPYPGYGNKLIDNNLILDFCKEIFDVLNRWS